MVAGHTQRRGRPRVQLLTPAKIFRAALDLVDDGGADALTMAALARRLDVRASSLYNHVDSKAALVEGIRDLVVDEIDCSAFTTEPWDVALERFAWSYRAAFSRHPHVVAMLATTPIDAPGTYRMYEAVAQGLVAAGWPDERVHGVIVGLEYILIGAALDASASGLMWDAASAQGHGAPTLARGMLVAGGQRAVADTLFAQVLGLFIEATRAEFERITVS